MAHYRDDGYVREAGRTTDERRRRRRGVIIVAILAVLLAVAMVVAIGVARGFFGSKPPTASTPTCAPAAPLPKPSAISVNVYNATTRPGLAARVAADLKAHGFTVLSTKNDPLGATLGAKGQVRYGSKGLPAATVVAAWAPGAELVKDKRNDASVDLVLWSSYRAVKAPSTPPATPGRC